MKKHILKYCESELNLKNTLMNGQCFNWQELAPNLFAGVLFNHYFEMKRIDPQSLEVNVYPNMDNIETRLNDYFYKSINLRNMY